MTHLQPQQEPQNPLKHNIADQQGEGSNTENAEVGIQDCPTFEAHFYLLIFCLCRKWGLWMLFTEFVFVLFENLCCARFGSHTSQFLDFLKSQSKLIKDVFLICLEKILVQCEYWR